MLVRYGRFTLMMPLIVGGVGCSNIPTSSHLQMDRIDEMRETSMTHLTDMSDNGMLQDMAVADFHFVAHTAELSGTGEARLDRMTPFLNHYGGVVRYDTTSTDTALIGQRLTHVREYLKLAGCDMSRVNVETGLSGGRGTSAANAMKIAARGTGKGGGTQGSLSGAPVVAPGSGQGNP